MGDVQWIKLKTDMFHDEKMKLIESLPKGDTTLIIWLKLLCAAGRANNYGHIFLTKNNPYTPQMLATLFNKPLKIVNQALETLVDFGLLKKDKKGVFSIINWEKHQNVEGMERMKIQNRERQKRHRNKTKSNATDNVTRNGKITLCNGTEKNRIEKNIYSQESNEYRLSQLLYNQIKERNPKHRKANLQKWAKNIDLLIRKDNRTQEEIEQVILWCQSDDFWKNNILSTESLRKSFDILYLKMNGSKSVTDTLPQLTNNEEGWK